MIKRYEDYQKVLDFYNAADGLYKRLAALEKNNELYSKEYMEYLNLLTIINSKSNKILLSHPLHDDYLDYIFNDLKSKYHLSDVDTIDFLPEVDNIKAKRFMEHIFELSLVNHNEDLTFDDSYKAIKIGDEEYSTGEGIAILESAGYDEIVDEINDIIYEEIEEKKYNELDEFDYAKLSIEYHVYLRYLLSAIKEENNRDIKKKLIDAKYRTIGIVKSLEDAFLTTPTNPLRIIEHQTKLESFFVKDNNYYTNYISYFHDMIEYLQQGILVRRKMRYNSIDEEIQDYLYSIRLKAYLSCIYNDELRDELTIKAIECIKRSDSQIDKKILIRSINLNKKYIIPNKH